MWTKRNGETETYSLSREEALSCKAVVTPLLLPPSEVLGSISTDSSWDDINTPSD